MSEELRIVNLDSKPKPVSPLKFQFLPCPEKKFRFCIIGASSSGKSMLIRNLLLRPEFGYKDYYGENIFVISETLNLEEDGWKCLNLPATHYLDHWDEGIVSEMIDYSSKQPNGCLFLLDDMAASGAMNSHKAGLLDKMFFQLRHSKGSVIVSVQNYKSLTPKMRNNSSAVCCFQLTNVSAQKQFMDDSADVNDIKRKCEPVHDRL